MWVTSAAFNAALASPARRWFSKLDILWSGTVVHATDVLMDGSIDIDDVAVRRAGKFTLIDPSGALAPADARDLLAPKGTEVRPYRGLLLPGGVIEWVPLGVFGINKPVVAAEANGSTRIDLTVHDRVAAIRFRRFSAPWVIPEGTPTYQAIADIVTSRFPVETRLEVTNHTTPALVFDRLTDPWDAVRALANADSLSAFFDPLGNLAVVSAEPQQTGITYEAGPQSVFMGSSREIDAERTYSGIIVNSEHPDRDPIRLELWDLNPLSPTYADGPFGRRPYGFGSVILRTEAQALAAAQTLLARVTKMRQSASLTTVGHPGHDVGDVITVRDPKTRTTGQWVVRKAKIPLRPGPIELQLTEHGEPPDLPDDVTPVGG